MQKIKSFDTGSRNELASFGNWEGRRTKAIAYYTWLALISRKDYISVSFSVEAVISMVSGICGIQRYVM